MSIFNNGNFAKPFNVSQPQLNSSDRTANLRSKTKYASAVNLAKNGGVLTKRDGSKYVGPVHTTTATMTSADSYSDLLDVTKGKYLLTPPPSSNLDTSFSPASGDVFYGSFTVTDYAEAKIPVTMLGAPGVTSNKYVTPNQLVAASNPPPPFNNTSIVVDPEYRLFYGKKTCGMRDYFKNVRIDPNADVRWTADGVVHSSRPYNRQQAQRILAHESQRLRGFQYPARVHLDLDNCESKPSITPVAPDAPVIYISSQTLTSDEPSELFTVTVAWPHGFDGGSPITSYTVYTSTGESYTVDPQPCLNSYTLYNIALTTQIQVSASNCIPQSTWVSGTPAPHCTPMTSPKSNPVNPNPPHLPTITVAFSSGPNPMPYEPGKVITMTITSDNPMPFSVTSSDLDNGLAQLNQPNGGGGTRALSTTNGYSITLLPGKNPTAARTPISVSFMQASGGGYSRGFATATLVILPALPPQIVFKLNGSSATTLTVPYSLSATIPMTISTSNYPVAQSAYQVSITYSGTDSGYAQVASGNASIQLLKNPSIPTTVSIIVTQPGTLNYPQGTATKTLTITSAPPPTITIGLASSMQYAPNATIPMTISTSNYPVAQSAYQVSITYSGTDSGYAQVASGNAGIQLLPNVNPSMQTVVTITVTQPGTQYYPQGTATKTLTITPAAAPTVTVYLNQTTVLTVPYESGTKIPLTIASNSSPQPQLSAYTVKSSTPNLARIFATTTGGDTIVSYSVELIANPPAPSQQVTITVIQPGTLNYPQGTGTATLIINPVPTITLTLNPALPVTYEPGKSIGLTITSSNLTSPPAPVVASSGMVTFQSSAGTLIVSSTDYNNYAVGQVLTANPGTGTFGGATVTVTGKYISNTWLGTIYLIYVSVVGGTPSTGDRVISNVIASFPKYTVTSNPAGLVQINPPSSGDSNYTLVLASNAYPTQDTPVAITATQAAGGGFAQGTGNTTLVISPAPPSIITLALNPVSPVTYQANKIIALNIHSTNTPSSLSAYTVALSLNAGSLAQVVQPSGSSGFTIVLGASTPTLPIPTITITVSQSASGSFGPGTGTTTIDIVLPQTNFIGWLPQGLTPKQPDFMTQEIHTITRNIYNMPNTGIACEPGGSGLKNVASQIRLDVGMHIVGGSVYIANFPPTTSTLTLQIGQFYTSPQFTHVPKSGVFNFTVDYTFTGAYGYPAGTYEVYWYADSGGGQFTLNVSNPSSASTTRTNWCGTLLATTTTGTPFNVMGFNNPDGSYTLSRYNQGATSLTTLLTGTGSITSINEQLITNSAMSGGRNLIVCGNFQSAAPSTTPSTTTRVNNIFQYNVDTQAVIPLQCATATSSTYPVGTNGQVWGCEVDITNNRVWVWGDFNRCGTTSASGGDTGDAALGVNLATGADFVTSANWTNPVSWQGCAAYLGVHAAKLGGASTGYALFCYKLQDYNGAFASPTSNPQTGVVRQAGTTWGRGTYLNGSNISGTVLSIYQFSSAAAGNWFIFAGTYTQATYDGTNATTAYGVSIMDATKSLTLGGVYGAALQPTMKNTDATVWKNGGYPTYPVRIALLSNNYLCITTSGYPVGSMMTYDFNNIASNTVAPTKWGGFTAPYSANYIGGTDPNSVKLITNLNANPFYYSQIFNMMQPMFSTTTIPDWTTIATGQSRTFTTTTPATLQVNQSITITYSAADYITGTITAISGTQITMTITHVASATYTSSTIYSNGPLNDTYVGVNNPVLGFEIPSYIPSATTVFKSGTVYLGGTALYGNPKFVLSIKDITTGITYGSSDQAWTNNGEPVPINFTGGVVVPAGSNINCPVTTDRYMTVSTLPGGPSGSYYYSTYPFPGSLQGYTLPYFAGAITLTPI